MTKLRQQFKDLLEESGLLKKNLSNLSSSERIKRHGELKTLRQMKKEFHQKEGPKKKKILQMKMYSDGMEEDPDHLGVNILLRIENYSPQKMFRNFPSFKTLNFVESSS